MKIVDSINDNNNNNSNDKVNPSGESSISIFQFLFFFSRADYGRSLNEIESSLPTEVEAREAAVDQALLDRTAKFLSTHTVELNLSNESSSRSLEEGT